MGFGSDDRSAEPSVKNFDIPLYTNIMAICMVTNSHIMEFVSLRIQTNFIYFILMSKSTWLVQLTWLTEFVFTEH